MRRAGFVLVSLALLAACGGEGPAREGEGTPAASSKSQAAAEAEERALEALPADRTGGAMRSVYTSLDLDACKLVDEAEEGESASWQCPGYGGFALVALSGDGRMDLDAGMDNGEWESIGAFNSLGEKVEWRTAADDTPFAIIYRVRSATPEVTPYSVLFVETIPDPGKRGCLLARIGGDVPEANARARLAADEAGPGFDCGKARVLELGKTQ